VADLMKKKHHRKLAENQMAITKECSHGKNTWRISVQVKSLSRYQTGLCQFKNIKTQLYNVLCK
jgi:hypothetical protein